MDYLEQLTPQSPIAPLTLYLLPAPTGRLAEYVKEYADIDLIQGIQAKGERGNGGGSLCRAERHMYRDEAMVWRLEVHAF